MTRQERSWVLYDWANSAYSMVVTVGIFPIFFKRQICFDIPNETSTAYLGYANTIAALLLAVCAPVLGALADHAGYKKRLFSVFLLIGLLGTLSLTLAQPGAWLSCLLLFGLSNIGFYGAIIYYDSYIVDVADTHRRDWISACAYGWGYVGGVIPFLLALAPILFFERFGFTSPLLPTRLAFVITVIWWAAFSIPLLLHVRQIHSIQTTQSIVLESIRRVAYTLRQVRAHKPIFIFLLAFFFYIDGVHTMIKMASSFGLDIGLGQSAILGSLVVVQLVAFPCALVYGILAKRFGARFLLFIGLMIYTIVTVWASFMTHAWEFFAMAILVGSAQGGVQSLSRSLFSRLIPPDNAAEFFGFYDIFGKFAAVLGPALVGIIAQTTGETRHGVLSLVILFGVGMWILSFVREHPQAHS